MTFKKIAFALFAVQTTSMFPGVCISEGYTAGLISKGPFTAEVMQMLCNSYTLLKF